MPPKNKEPYVAHRLRILNKWMGTMGSLATRHSTRIKRTTETAAAQRRPMMMPELQAYVVPPQLRGKRTRTTAARRTNVPRKSIRLILLAKDPLGVGKFR